ncbi:MAG TPA: hypothetical protein VK540_15900 [Polyangiaceae bacterium]|nr:hypothetical protein [Polyangiaceae bacterium]
MAKRLADLLDFVPKATPSFRRPTHLAPLARLLDRSEREPVRAVFNTPPRHFKTELMKHFSARQLIAAPTTRIIYASYSTSFAEKKSREIRSLYQRVGGQLSSEASSRRDWRTRCEPGGLWACSVESGVTGEGGDLIIVDDPHKGRAEAESAIERDKIFEWFRNDLLTRCEPGASVFVIQTRWHPEDLAGRLIAEGWDYVNLPALDDNGRALCPERFSAERLCEIREELGSYGWASLYMGAPVPRGGALFRDAYFYDELPAKFRIGKGCDLAYTAKTRADRSAAVVMLESAGTFYVVDVRTAQVKVPEFLSVLKGIDASYAGSWHWYTSTTEAGLADLATATAGVTIESERAAADKFTRAQPVSAAWNSGKILLPRQAHWLDQFVSEVCGFTGVGDRRDDQVDALASAFTRVGGAGVRALMPNPQQLQRMARATRWHGQGSRGFG